MRIAIIGSYEKENSRYYFRKSFAEFKVACMAIGKELARRQQRIIIGGTWSQTAEYSVVEGIIEIADGLDINGPLIEINRPADDAPTHDDDIQSSIYTAYAERYPSLFAFHPRTEGWWQGAHLISIREADAIITIGGRKSTYLAGLASIIANKKLIPISCFGGSSVQLLEAMEKMSTSNDLEKLRQLNGPWTLHALNLVIQVLGIEAPPKVLLIHGRSKDWIELKDWLQGKIGIYEVIVMKQEFGVGQTLPEKFEDLAEQVDGAIAIATPDDMGGLKEESLLHYRARQNVWLEVGWFWGRLGRRKVMVLCKKDTEIPSDLLGLEYYAYEDSPLQVREKIRTFIESLK